MDKQQTRNLVEVLKHARARIAKPGGWTQFAFARTADGKQVQANNPDAVSFCTRGAVHAERTKDTPPEMHAAAWNASEFLEQMLDAAIFDRLEKHGIISEDFQCFVRKGLCLWNDCAIRKQEHAVYLYDAAIERAEALLAAAAA